MSRASIFISSTFYDLQPVRSDLMKLIHSFGCEPVMFEAPEFAPDPTKPAPEAAISRVEDCQGMVLIIGNTFGSEYAPGGRSITNEEYRRARAANLPIFVFVKEAVWTVYNTVYKTNREETVDYSRTVTDTRLFEFLAEIESDRVWIDSFSGHSEISDKLAFRFGHCIYGFLELLKRREIDWNIRQGKKSEGQQQVDMFGETMVALAQGVDRIVADNTGKVRQQLDHIKSLATDNEYLEKVKAALSEAADSQKAFAEMEIEPGDDEDDSPVHLVAKMAMLEARAAGGALVEIYKQALDVLIAYEQKHLAISLDDLHRKLYSLLRPKP